MRSYLRIDPELVERKLAAGYSGAQVGAYIALLCAAEQQPKRGRFKSISILKAALADLNRHLPFLFSQRDVTETDDGLLYVEGWDEWQEGNWQVAERMQRVRDRRGESAPKRSQGAIRTANYRARKAASQSVTPVTPPVTVRDASQSVTPVTSRPSRVEAVGGRHIAIAHADVVVESGGQPNGHGPKTDEEARAQAVGAWWCEKKRWSTLAPAEHGHLQAIGRLAVPPIELLKFLQKRFEASPTVPASLVYFWEDLQVFESEFLKKQPAITPPRRPVAAGNVLETDPDEVVG